MDDPTGPGWTWPYWKFGLQREDLEKKLHDQYNTFNLAILDPEAFHHDVQELANRATTTDELHQLLAERKQLRVRELNESLESAAFEIIGNPSLVGTDQWQHAVQLFRTRSLDSLVRYFASYLPEQHPWHKPADSGSITSSSADSCPSLFDDEYYDPIILTEEPLEIADEESIVKDHLPPSPRSMTMCSTSSMDSHLDGSQPDFALTPARTLSYSESESDHLESSASTLYDVSEVNTPAPEEEDVTPEVASGKETLNLPKHISITSESDTPTPKPEHHVAAFFEQTKPSLPRRRHRSLSPSSARPLSGQEVRSSMQQRDPRKPELPTHRTQVADDAARRWKETGYMERLRERMFNPLQRGRGQGRKTQTSISSRINKPSPDRTRLKGRKRIDS
ncbi:hypothetical protein QBC45DRAFT_17682 [Copromyces sp. CBS 386.78]|nr:hypothetical protein QBC45DRAFT_17682 [Copromyces sp. CBS 386.78]